VPESAQCDKRDTLTPLRFDAGPRGRRISAVRIAHVVHRQNIVDGFSPLRKRQRVTFGYLYRKIDAVAFVVAGDRQIIRPGVPGESAGGQR